jgi:hypothetical protein
LTPDRRLRRLDQVTMTSCAPSRMDAPLSKHHRSLPGLGTSPEALHYAASIRLLVRCAGLLRRSPFPGPAIGSSHAPAA